MPSIQSAVRKSSSVLLSLPTILVLSIALLTSGCGGSAANSSGGGGTTPTPPSTPSTANEWTWMSGSSAVPTGASGVPGVYGTLGIASASNVPGGRNSSVSWIDNSGNLWLFGGAGIDSTGGSTSFPGKGEGGLNDLWEFNPATKEWAWVSGSNMASTATNPQPGIYGTLGVAATSNVPGARGSAVSWTDNSGNLWLFGGTGVDSNGYEGYLNDLWEFNPTTKEWTWVSGSMPSNTQVGSGGTFVGQTGNYGTLGTAAANNVPGGRDASVSWKDSAGNLWLFGGDGYDSTGTEGYLNDLWEFSPANNEWTWVSGSNTANTVGVYGALGVAATSNVPGARGSAVSWTDNSGNLWLFGGSNNAGILNDLWEFNLTTKEWTWVSGANTVNANGVYGTLGTAAAANVPGSRYYAISWIDKSGNFWLFGGEIFNQSSATYEQMNDLWKFSPTTKEWTWVSGSSTANATGTYGILGTASASNVSGSRADAVSWIDASGNLWLFGGFVNTSNGALVDLNDLWEYQP